jgi:hypothetical protein
MANEIFDRETMLDLLVNIVPLFILAFFVVAFAVVSPFGVDPLASSIQFGLIAVPFVLLTVLTYFAARAVAGSERKGAVYLPGQAGVRGAEPLEDPTEERDDGSEESELDDGGSTPLEGDSDEGSSGPDAPDGDAEATADESGPGADDTADPAGDGTGSEDEADSEDDDGTDSDDGESSDEDEPDPDGTATSD